MNKVGIGVIALIVVLGGAYAFTSSQKDAAMMEQKAMEEKALMEQKATEESAMMEETGDTMMESDDAMMAKDDSAMMMKGTYEAYSPEKLAWAEHGKVVLFFKASWCPSCRSLDADIKGNMASIPEGVTILEVDYDSSTELKKKYGVTQQHTLVQVDASGNQIAKWGASPTLADVVSKIK